MGFFSKLGSSLANTAVQGTKQGLVSGILSASRGSYNNVLGGNSLLQIQEHIPYYVDSIDMSNADYIYKGKELYSTTYKDLDNADNLTKTISKKAKIYDESYNSQKISFTQNNNLENNFKLPQWGYDVFINERSSFQKGLGGPTNDPGYFYFKIFFNFDTNYGLFGGILNSNSTVYESSINTAIKYLSICQNNYKIEKLLDRSIALQKFTRILSFINSQAPWFFTGVSGLDKAGAPITNEFSKEKSIEIEVSEDAIDMRLATLMDLYKYACYDEYNSKEIIPENLRKFDMSIMLFASPLKYFHTAIKDGSKKLSYKGFNLGKGYKDFPSFKLYTFTNCEISPEVLGNMVPNSITNDKPFQLGKTKIKITYDRVYTHTCNEFNQILFGTTGIYFNEYGDFQNDRYSIIQKIVDYGNKDEKNKKTLTDIAESIVHTNLMDLTGYSLGNIYGQDSKIGSDYWKTKINWQFNKNISVVQDIGTNVLLKLLNSHYNASARLHTAGNGTKISDTGWLPGYGEMAVGSEYWKDKIKSLKTGKKISSGYSDYVTMKQRASNFSFKQTLYDMFRNP